MAAIFTTKSFTLAGSHQYIFKDVGSARRSGHDGVTAMSLATGGTGATLRDDVDCPIALVPDDIECFGLDGIQDIIDNRNATYLNMGLFLEGYEPPEGALDVMGEASFGSIITSSGGEQGLMTLATRGGYAPYAGYVLAKLEYMAPCEINGALAEIQYPDAEIICFFGTIKNSAGVQKTGAAYENLLAVYQREVAALGQGVSFIPAHRGDHIPEATELSTLCWVLLGVGPEATSGAAGGQNNGGQGGSDKDPQYPAASGSDLYGGSGSGGTNIICPDTFPTLFLQVCKPVWRSGHLGIIGTDMWAANEAMFGMPSSHWNLGHWFIIIGSLLGSSLGVCSMPYVDVPPEFARFWDVDSNAAVTIVDVVAFINWLQVLGEDGVTGSIIDYSFNIDYPEDCCTDTTRQPPDIPPTEPEDPPVVCDAELEILDVRCVPSQSGLVGGTHGGARENFVQQMFAEGKGSKGAAGGAGGWSLNASVSRGDDCNDDDVVRDAKSNDMYILVGMKNELPVAGFQFDVGFNKYSSAPLASCGSSISSSEMAAKDWNMVSKAFDDRFGYDKIIRVVSWQPLVDFSKDKKNKGFDVQDRDFFAGMQTFPSIEPHEYDFQGVALVHVRNAPPTSCACPKKRMYIDGDLKAVKTKNPDQLKNPDRYTEGKEWHGAVVYHAGSWWTASQKAGPLSRDASSMALRTVWEGIELMNKRVVTNYKTHKPYHTNYGLKYMGEFLGLQSTVPTEYGSFAEFFTSSSGIAPWVWKTLHNGLNAQFPDGVSEYDFLWDELYDRYIKSLEASSGSPINAANKQILLNDFDKGFCDDATLDGKFDVADLVAIHNSAQLRMLFPDPLAVGQAGATALTWQNPPTNWEIAGREGNPEAFKKWQAAQKRDADKRGQEQDGLAGYSIAYMADHKGTATSQMQLPNFYRIVPSYCLNSFNTATMPDHCPAIVGGVYAETVDTIKNNITAGGKTCNGKRQLQFISQRVDIQPDKAATAKFVFAKKPDVDAVLVVTDTVGYKEKIRFTASNTGTALDGGYKSIKIGADLNATMTEVNTFFASHTETNMTCALTPSSGGKTGFTLTQGGIGSRGHTIIKASNRMNLILSQGLFAGGSSYLASLPTAFRTWAEYFKTQHHIKNIDLYQNEEEYGADGASFFEIRTAVNHEGRGARNTPILGYVSKSVATLNFCGGYDAATSVKVKILPGDGFKMVDVYDAETGALLTAATSAAYKNFYSVPNHGKMKLVSHNFNSSGGDRTEKSATLVNSAHFTPITKDGGALVTAKVFVTPQPKYEEGKYIELLCGTNEVLGTSNIELWSGVSKPLGQLRQEYGDKPSAVGPSTSQFSQNYKDDSSSLHTYADYMLHAEVIGPKHVRVKYNTMKPFKYATFTVRTFTGAEIESVKLLQNVTAGDSKPWGWTATHSFTEDTTDVYGYPLDPDVYSRDGHSRVSVYITGSYTDENGVVEAGMANPPEYNGSGDLCDIFFKEPLFEKFPLKGKKYICPPIGGDTFDKFPSKPYSSYTDDTQNGVEKDYPEGERENKKYFQDDGVNPLIANFDAEDSFATQVESVDVAGTEKVSVWVSTPGVTSSPHNSNTAHRPNFNVNTNDTRKSVVFAGGQGLSTAASATGYRSHDIHKWSAYALVDMTATLNSGAMTNGKEATIFKVGGNGTSQFNLELKVVKAAASGVFNLQAVSSANDGSGGGQVTTLEKSVTVAGSDSDLHGWHIISWIGDAEAGRATLYVDGTAAATSATTHSNVLGAHGIVWYIGHNGSNTSINATIGHTDGKPFGGRISQLMLYNEAHNDTTREKVETYFAVKNPNEGTAPIQENLPGGHIGNKDTVGGQKEEGIDITGYKDLNKTEQLNLKRKENAIAKRKDVGDSQIDLGSDRCAAQWVSEHVCLDKSAQTLLNISCEGTGAGFQLGD